MKISTILRPNSWSVVTWVAAICVGGLMLRAETPIDIEAGMDRGVPPQLAGPSFAVARAQEYVPLATNQPAAPLGGILADWTFEEGTSGQPATGMIDVSGLNHHATKLFGQPVWTNSPPGSQGAISLYLPPGVVFGSGFGAAEAPEFNLTNQFTLEAAITPGEMNRDAFRAIIIRTDQATLVWPFSLAYRSDPPTVFFGIASAPNVIASVTAPFPLDGRSHHIAGVYSNQVLQVFIDGSLRATTLSDITPDPRSKDGVFVGVNNIGGFWFHGSLERIRISNQALRPEEFFTAGSFTHIKPVTNDLWDVANGSVVTGTSGLWPGYDARDAFGGSYSTRESEDVVFEDVTNPHYVHSLEWRTPTPVTIDHFRIFAAGDGVEYLNEREFRAFRLWAKMPGSTNYNLELYSYEPQHPYTWVDPITQLLVDVTIPPVTAQEFRAEFDNYLAGRGYDGPRIIELDGFGPAQTNINDGIPATWRLQNFGPQWADDARAAAVADPDGDGAINQREYLDGTDPLNPQSIRRVPTRVSTYAGTTVQGGKDGFRTNATFFSPGQLTQDPVGRIWVVETVDNGSWEAGYGAHRIRIIDAGGFVSTYAGGEEAGKIDGSHEQARFRCPTEVVFDHLGNAFLTDRSNFQVREISSSGWISTFAGSTRGRKDGIGGQAQFDMVLGLAIDAGDNLYVCDFGNSILRKITPQGEVTTFAGGVRGDRDGQRLEANLDSPSDIARGSDGTLYISDWLPGKLKKIAIDGVVSTVASGIPYIETVALDAEGNVYVTSPTPTTIIKFDANGREVWRLQPTAGYSDGPISGAQIGRLGSGPLFLQDGSFLISDNQNACIRRIATGPAPLVTINAPSGEYPQPIMVQIQSPIPAAEIFYTLNGEEPTPAASRYQGPLNLNGTVELRARAFVQGTPVSEITAASYTTPKSLQIVYWTNQVAVTSIAGTGQQGFADGTNAAFHSPNGIAVDRLGYVYVADTHNHRIRRISPDGWVSTFAGSGVPGLSPGYGIQAQFNLPIGLCIGNQGFIYVADAGNNCIRLIQPDGLVTTLAGNGQAGYRDGVGTNAQFRFPNDLCADAAGNVYVTEFDNHTVRRIRVDGTVETWVGDGIPGFVDGPRQTARLNQPSGIAIDRKGNLFVSEYGNQRIRFVGTDGQVLSAAGDGTAGYRDAQGREAQLNHPDGLAVDQVGRVYFADFENHAVRVRDTDGMVYTVAGDGIAGDSNAGTNTRFFNPAGLTMDLDGNLYVADWTGERMRKIILSEPGNLIIAQRVLPASCSPGKAFTVSIEVKPSANVTVYALEEVPPTGWSAYVDGRQTAVWDWQNRKFKFGPYFDHEPRTLTYTLICPENETAAREVYGQVSADGILLDITGDSILQPVVAHPADGNPLDWRISLQELTAYSAAWKRGQIWASPPNPIPMSYVTRAAFLWQEGERYQVDVQITNAPNWWVVEASFPGALAPTVGSTSLGRFNPRNSGAIVMRLLPAQYQTGQATEVVLQVNPPPFTRAYAVEEQVPPGWTVKAASDDGCYDPGSDLIKWGPFLDHSPRNLSYTLAPPKGTSGLAKFVGTVSCDGNVTSVNGSRILRPASITPKKPSLIKAE
jgi:sugar lactone lactonase YvrE